MAEEDFESLTHAIELLEARMGDVVADLTTLKDQFQSQFEHKLLPTAPGDAAAGVQAHQHPHQQQRQKAEEEAEEEARSERSSQFPVEDVTLQDVHERLQRLELLLFRLPMPDFLQLDRTIAQLMRGGGGGGPSMPMEGVPEEHHLGQLNITAASAAAGEEADEEDTAVEAKQPRILDTFLLEELGIFNDYDAYKGARSVTSGAGGSGGTSDDDGSSIAGLEVFKKDDGAEDSDPEKPKITRSTASQPSPGNGNRVSGLRIKVVATKNKPRGSEGEVMPSASELLARW